MPTPSATTVGKELVILVGTEGVVVRVLNRIVVLGGWGYVTIIVTGQPRLGSKQCSVCFLEEVEERRQTSLWSGRYQ